MILSFIALFSSLIVLTSDFKLLMYWLDYFIFLVLSDSFYSNSSILSLWEITTCFRASMQPSRASASLGWFRIHSSLPYDSFFTTGFEIDLLPELRNREFFELESLFAFCLILTRDCYKSEIGFGCVIFVILSVENDFSDDRIEDSINIDWPVLSLEKSPIFVTTGIWCYEVVRLTPEAFFLDF